MKHPRADRSNTSLLPPPAASPWGSSTVLHVKLRLPKWWTTWEGRGKIHLLPLLPSQMLLSCLGSPSPFFLQVPSPPFPPHLFSPLPCTVYWIKVSVFPAENGPFSASLILWKSHKCFTATSRKDWPLLLLIRELRGSPRHFPVKLSPLNEWQATSQGVGSKVTQQLFGNRQLVTWAGFRLSNI